jgi:polysaccharide export outer membrane protein
MSGSRIGLISLAALAILGLGGCSFFPVSGPSSADIESGNSQTVPYHLVKLTSETIDILAAHEPKGLAGAFTDQRPSAKIVFGIGDVIAVRVFEAAAGGLFIPLEAGVRPGNFVDIWEKSSTTTGISLFPTPD